MSASSIHDTTAGMRRFLDYAAKLKGDEKGEAQLFLDHFFRALGHDGTIQAGATPEDRLSKAEKGKQFLDLHWPGRVLFEMKKRGERLDRHLGQATQYWLNMAPNRPPYVILCNFDEFWIYDFNSQVYQPMDRVTLAELPDRWAALRFLLPQPQTPLFDNDRVEVTRKSADAMARLFQMLVKRGERREAAQRFVLQCLVAMVSEDVGMLPNGLFYELAHECFTKGTSSYDLIGGLFNQMNRKEPARGGRFKDVDYFNGGLFAVVEPIELEKPELELLRDSAKEQWRGVNPAIFGGLFQSSMDAEERHAFGAHFTSEIEILKVVEPTIVRPWREKIAKANKLQELKDLRTELRGYTVLDPACGSGNFLYVAYRELKRIEGELLEKVEQNFSRREAERMKGTAVTLDRFYGIDVLPFAVELARVTLVLAKELYLVEQKETQDKGQESLQLEPPLPLDNLDDNIVCADALFARWPKADAIVGNPPYLDARKLTMEHGAEYSARVREAFPDVPGRADFCVYWFRKAHDHLKKGGHAGLVGTNSIRQNYSREGGLDYIVGNGGTITDAVSTQVWPGEAAVHVSIVNWVKGKAKGPFTLAVQETETTERKWRVVQVPVINAALSEKIDVGGSRDLTCAQEPKLVFEGQQPG